MKTIIILYVVLIVVFITNFLFAIAVLDAVRQAVSVRERPKLVVKINELKSMRIYSVIWPYVLYKLIKADAQ